MANYNLGADWNGQDGNVTTGGSAGTLSESFYGTSDQGGNVWEWNETVVSGSAHVLRSGSWTSIESFLRSSFEDNFGFPTSVSPGVGFRVASSVSQAPVPTVSEWGLAAMMLLILTAGTIVHAKPRRAGYCLP